MFTVGQLREMLEGVDDEVVVKIAVQPNYPFTHDVAGVNLLSPNREDIKFCCDFLNDSDPLITAEDRKECGQRLAELEAEPQVLYILEGGNQKYASRDLWNI